MSHFFNFNLPSIVNNTLLHKLPNNESRNERRFCIHGIDSLLIFLNTLFQITETPTLFQLLSYRIYRMMDGTTSNSSKSVTSTVKYTPWAVSLTLDNEMLVLIFHILLGGSCVNRIHRVEGTPVPSSYFDVPFADLLTSA